jgi:hypothetical protein
MRKAYNNWLPASKRDVCELTQYVPPSPEFEQAMYQLSVGRQIVSDDLPLAMQGMSRL